jgi:tetratricopeptide (TPR) repeat protein
VRAALILLILVATVQATPSDDLDKAREAYRGGQYGIALPLFNALLYPPPPRLAQQQELKDAYLALGVCRFETGDPTGAKREFEQALALDPASTIDPVIVSDLSAIQAFNETKLDMKARADDDAEAKRRAELRKIRESYVGVEQHSLALNFVPFGVGQFQNHQWEKGIAFSMTEGLTFVTSVSIYAYLVNTYGIRSTRVPIEDGPSVRHLQQIEIGTGVAFLGLWVWSAIDAYRHFTPATRVEIDESLLPPELRGLDKPARPTKPGKTSLLDHLAPMITPNGGGIGFSWETE